MEDAVTPTPTIADTFGPDGPIELDEWPGTPWLDEELDEPDALVASNPWHDEVGRFAPKGAIGGGPALDGPVTTSDAAARMSGAWASSPERARFVAEIDELQERFQVPVEVKFGFDEFIADKGVEATDDELMHALSAGFTGNACVTRGQNVIYVTGKAAPLTRSPDAHPGDWKTTASHEFGHVLDHTFTAKGYDEQVRAATVSHAMKAARKRWNKLVKDRDEGRISDATMRARLREHGISRYGLTNDAEFYAEMFTAWWGTNGQTSSPFLKRFAEEMGWATGVPKARPSGTVNVWGELLPEFAVSDELPDDIIDIVPMGALMVETDSLPVWIMPEDLFPDALVASNPWHDELGKFAPKGAIGGARAMPTTDPHVVHERLKAIGEAHPEIKTLTYSQRKSEGEPGRQAWWSDGRMNGLASVLGLDGPPTVGTADDVADAVKAGGIEIYRGVGNKIAHTQFASGEYAAGVGLSGGGFYFTRDSGIAQSYSGSLTDTSFVLRGAVKPDARMISWNEACDLNVGVHEDAILTNTRWMDGLDVSHVALAAGYDGVRITDDVVLIMNRGAVIVDEGTLP